MLLWCLMIVWTMLILLVPLSQGMGAGDDAKRIADIITWIRDNGGWISDKVEVKQIVGSLSGIFAKEALDEGEVVATIPWELIIVPTYPEDAEWLCEKADDLKKRLRKDPSEMNPYERYLLSRPRSHVPLFWSAEGKSLLREVNKDFTVFWFDLSIEQICKGMIVDDIFLQALMLLQTRGEGVDEDTLVPFADLLNHRNGNYTNVEPHIDPGNGGYRIVSKRGIEPGEELQNSYNFCEWCDPLALTTAQLFEVYGFVESSPQIWLVPEFGMIFDVTFGDDGEILLFDMMIASSDESTALSFLQQRLVELGNFQHEHKGRTDIPKQERDGIFQFHEAVVNAFSAALEKATEGVWVEEYLEGANDGFFDEYEGDSDGNQYTYDNGDDEL